MLVVISGPTATGKSALAVDLAQRVQGVILGADSRQIYQGFDIGTAKPDVTVRAQVWHQLIDWVSPCSTVTVAEYQSMAEALISNWQAQGVIPFLVGGTGLYIQAITDGLRIPQIPPQPTLRRELAHIGQVTCYAWLQQVDAASAARIHPHDQVRTLRALEVFYVTGRPLSTLQTRRPPSYPILHIGLDCSTQEVLHQRIQQRTHAMIKDGLVGEYESLRDKYGPYLPLLRTLGYREVGDYTAGRLSLEEAESLIVLRTRQLAKRQRTWFRAQPGIFWLNVDSEVISNESLTLIGHDKLRVKNAGFNSTTATPLEVILELLRNRQRH